MKLLFGFPAPECQAEYCLLCSDRETECCPCEAYLDLPDKDKFPLDEDDLLDFLSEVENDSKS